MDLFDRPGGATKLSLGGEVVPARRPRGPWGRQFALGLLYNKGQGVPKNLTLAYMWLNLSASQAVGNVRDFKVRIRDSIASKMTPDQVEEAQRLTTGN